MDAANVFEEIPEEINRRKERRLMRRTTQCIFDKEPLRKTSGVFIYRCYFFGTATINYGQR
jgi:hypothetical protein